MAVDRRAHSPGLPPWTVQLPEDASAPRVARAALDEWLRDAEPGVRRDARSVVSELVANAVGHGSPPIELSVEQRGGRMRIEVADAGEPSGRRPPEALSQRIVNDVAARWGCAGTTPTCGSSCRSGRRPMATAATPEASWARENSVATGARSANLQVLAPVVDSVLVGDLSSRRPHAAPPRATTPGGENSTGARE
jgi:anti-sigma regulatory factor (Ser/Thr protein kinase)